MIAAASSPNGRRGPGAVTRMPPLRRPLLPQQSRTAGPDRSPRPVPSSPRRRDRRLNVPQLLAVLVAMLTEPRRAGPPERSRTDADDALRALYVEHRAAL